MCTNCNNNPLPQMTAAEKAQWDDDYLNGRLVYPTLSKKTTQVSRSVEPEKPQDEPNGKEMLAAMLTQKGIKFKLTYSADRLRQLLDNSNEQ